MANTTCPKVNAHAPHFHYSAAQGSSHFPGAPAHPTRVPSAQEPPYLQEHQPLTTATVRGWQKGLRSLVRDHMARELKDFFTSPHQPVSQAQGLHPDEVSLITPVAARVQGLGDAEDGLQAGTQTSLVFLDRLV